MNVGVLALQGDFREHLLALGDCGVSGKLVKSAADISEIDALIIPGGESTTISKLAKAFDLFNLISKRIADGMPTYGSCAGMILLSTSILDPASEQDSFGGIEMQVRRNAFGRQTESFEVDLEIKGISGAPFRGVFIRAPWVESFGEGVEVLSTLEVGGVAHPVAVRSGRVMATSFHPELTGDNRVHRFFLEEVCKG
ncbi:MAG: pyridoxal 5'-phosphate synthase glutaminase subunit PdxT [Actinobacteria bacterium]|uniref:glutaminase n=1 Tax=freshwater metagenome TaxID=449393 RepID=A0A6J6GNI9_9ZZZZ|nr:pyridoxal 5'-phosphate synthase glutaminase subunit PdxT [Actinomycetota bacterium]